MVNKCKTCKTELIEDKKAKYFHWKYFCPKCNAFMINPTDIIK